MNIGEPRFINHEGKGFTFIGQVGIREIDELAHINDALIDDTGGVKIGKNAHFGHQVMVLSTEHPIDIKGGEERMRTLVLKPVVIGDDAYIGSRAIILAGSRIGKGAYIAAGAVVAGAEVGDGELWGGVPAKKIKSAWKER